MNKKIASFILASAFCSFNVSAQTDALLIDNTGKVGIGITPEAQLDVNGNIMLRSTHLIFNSSNGVVDYGDSSNNGNFLIRCLKTQGNIGAYDNIFIANKSGVKFNSLSSLSGNLSINSPLTVNNELGVTNTLTANGQVKVNNSIFMNQKPIYFKGDRDTVYGIGIGGRNADKTVVDVFGWDGVRLGYTNSNRQFNPQLTVTAGKVGIGTETPRAVLDVATDCMGGKLSTVMGRMAEGDGSGDGTYLGVRCFSTQINPYGGKSFSLEHSFNGKMNSSISFHRGQGYEDGYMTFATRNTERMRLDADGHLGIGVQDPHAGLDILTTYSHHNNNYAYINGNESYVVTKGSRRSPRNLGIITRGGDIAASDGGEFIIYSDARIKNKLAVSDSKNDLSLLKRLRVTDYKYIDKVAYGNDTTKGFIAQEVEKIFPQAVSLGSECIPDIYAVPTQVKEKDGIVNITMKKEHHLTTGDVVKMMIGTGHEEDTVTVTGLMTFSIHHSGATYDNVFVFGRRVNDFRRVDYDRLYTLNVSATQELAKEVDRLTSENNELKNKLETLQQQVGQIITKLGVSNGAITASAAK